MRQARIRGVGISYYHCISRVVDARFILGSTEKEHFVALMRKLEAFHGMRVVTYCVMSNHFHILIEEPDRELVQSLDAETILKRIGLLYDSHTVRTVREELERARAAAGSGDQWEERILNRYRKRMGDLAAFMKELKQRFSAWYNRLNDRRGTLWEERYKSVLVEGDQAALMTIAAYIDLNPVRAGMVRKVEDYRWCGYASAMGGNPWAQRGLGRILSDSAQVSGSGFEDRWEETASTYRLWLYDQGEIREVFGEESEGRKKCAVGTEKRKQRSGFSREEVEEVINQGGRISLGKALLCRVRFLTDGGVIGSEKFVNGVFERNRGLFGKRRESGARPMSKANWGRLHILRDLRKEVITLPDRMRE